MSKMLGIATITVNGSAYDSEPGATLDLGGVKRNPKVYGRKVGHYEETVHATITMTIGLTEGLSLKELQELAAATVIFKADTGQSYVVRNAFRTETINMKDGDGGSVAISIAGEPAEELL